MCTLGARSEGYRSLSHFCHDSSYILEEKTAETIWEPKEIQKIFYDFLKSATQEVLILFSKTDIFQGQQQERLFESVKEEIAHGVNIRDTYSSSWRWPINSKYTATNNNR